MSDIKYATGITDRDLDRVNLASQIINGLSFGGALLVVIVVALSNWLKLHASRRLSFRMSMWIGISDLLFCLISFVNVDDQFPLCPIFTAISYFCNLLYVFLTTSITLNLHLTLLHPDSHITLRVRHFILREFRLVALCVGLALIITFVPFSIAVQHRKCVLFHMFQRKGWNVLMFWLTLGIWNTICFVYTSIIAFLVVKRLSYHRRILVRTDLGHRQHQPSFAPTQLSLDKNGSDATELQIQLGRVARRIIFYPIVPLVTQSFYIILDTYFLLQGERTLSLLYLFYIFPYSSGLLNAVVFLYDPAIPEVYRELRTRYFASRLTRSDSSIPVLSRLESDHSALSNLRSASSYYAPTSKATAPSANHFQFTSVPIHPSSLKFKVRQSHQFPDSTFSEQTLAATMCHSRFDTSNNPFKPQFN